MRRWPRLPSSTKTNASGANLRTLVDRLSADVAEIRERCQTLQKNVNVAMNEQYASMNMIHAAHTRIPLLYLTTVDSTTKKNWSIWVVVYIGAGVHDSVAPLARA